MRSVFFVLLTAVVSQAASPAMAQDVGSARTAASGGLFGATRSDPADRNRLNFLVGATEALDSELPPELLAELPQGNLQSGGFSTMVTGAADYAHTRNRIRIGATADTAFRYYERLNRLDTVGLSGGLGVDVNLPKTARLQLEQRAAYSPSYFYQLFPSVAPPELGEAIPTAPDYRIVQSDSYVYGSDATLGMDVARRTRVTGGGTYDRTSFRGELAERALRPQLETYAAHAGVSQGIRRNITLSGDYEYRTGDFGFGASHEQRLTIAGVYSRALSRSRRAIFRVEVTPSTLEVPVSSLLQLSDVQLSGPTPDPADPVGGERVFRLQGGASVEYPLRRTWMVMGTVQRGVEYIALLGEPVLSNAAQVTVGGLLTRRIDLSAAGAFSNGSSVTGQASQLDSRTFDVRVRYALSRMLAVYSEYVFFSYNLAGRASLAPGLPPVFNQHGLRVGAMLWASAF